MERHLFTASVLALVAITTPALAQVQADHDVSVDKFFEDLVEKDRENGTITMVSAKPFTSEDIVVVGTRYGSVFEDDLTVPSSILTEGEIAARGQQYVSDLLRSLPGIAVSNSGSGSGLTQIRVRGSEANHVLVLVDGVEVANPNSGEFDLAGLRASDIVKIEVLRGEQSALYGSDAIAGVISIVTRAGETSESWRLNVEGGSRDTVEGQVSGIIPLGDASLSLNGNLFSTVGYDVSGLGGERDGSESKSLNIGLNAVDVGPVRFDFKFGTSELDTDFDEDTDFNGRLDNTASQTTVKTQTARGDARFETGKIDHKISLGYLETDTDTRAGFTTRTVGERINANWVAGISRDAHSLTVLGEWERETYRINPNFTEAGAEPKNEVGAMAADYRYSQDAITLTASLRHDINDLFADATTWRFGAGYALPWDGRIRASVGTGIKNPSMIELFGFFPGSNFTGNRDLQPEESIGISAGYEQSIGNFEGSIDVFYSELQEEITTVFNPDFTSTVINLETDSTRSGVELEARYTLGDVNFTGAATFLDSEQNDIEEIRRPDFTASVSANWQATDALFLSAFIDHTGSQLDTDFATFTDVTLDSFTLVGARAEYALNDYVALSLRGENLLDEDYQEVVSFASPGRAVFLGLSADF